jgi:DNA-binding transcriptional LysR family regulator
MGIDAWDEIRTAYQVARLGTVSGAAEVLGVHHATVIRHIDALERRLGARLFQRHARGYTPTEAGRDLLSVAQTTDEQFGQLASRIKGHGETVSGELVVTVVPTMADLVTAVVVAFQRKHPDVIVRLLTDIRVFRLDYGEAHVAIRAGALPQEPDNVVQPLSVLRMGLYAAPDYIRAHGLPANDADLLHHNFVCHDIETQRPPFFRWLRATVPPQNLVFLASDTSVLRSAIAAGAGIGFLSPSDAEKLPDLVEVLPPRSDWESQIWVVTHVDLHRTRKVQAFLAEIKEAARHWAG